MSLLRRLFCKLLMKSIFVAILLQVARNGGEPNAIRYASDGQPLGRYRKRNLTMHIENSLNTRFLHESLRYACKA